MLKQENRYDFRERMVSPHVPGKRDFSLVPDADEFVLENEPCFVCEQDFGAVVSHAIEYFTEFLTVSMGMEVCPQPKAGAQAIVLKLADDLGEYNTYKGYRVAVDDSITISGYDERGLAQALYNLEDVLSLWRAPYLKKGVFCWKPMYSPMMVHSGYGFDEFPDAYLQQVARSGRDAILIFVKGVNQTRRGFLDFNEVIARAASYGLDVYAYSTMTSNHHPDNPEAEAAYDSTYGQLFEKCSGFKGRSICYTNYIDFEKGHGAAFVSLRVPEEIKSLKTMKRLFGEGLKLLDEIPDKNTSLEYLVNQGYFMYHNIISGIHSKQWYCLKCDAKASRSRETLLANIEKMETLLQEEIENSQRAIPYAQRDSRLGWEPSMDYLGNEWHIRWKIRHAEYVLNTELAR